MPSYQFRLLVAGPFTEPLSDEELLDATDALGEAGFTDCAVSPSGPGLELEFERVHQSLQDAISSAIHDVEKAGYLVTSIQMDRDAVLATGSH